MALQGQHVKYWAMRTLPPKWGGYGRDGAPQSFLGGGLIQLDAGDVPRTLVPLDVAAGNNVFASSSQTPLILLTGQRRKKISRGSSAGKERTTSTIGFRRIGR